MLTLMNASKSRRHDYRFEKRRDFDRSRDSHRLNDCFYVLQKFISVYHSHRRRERDYRDLKRRDLQSHRSIRRHRRSRSRERSRSRSHRKRSRSHSRK